MKYAALILVSIALLGAVFAEQNFHPEVRPHPRGSSASTGYCSTPRIFEAIQNDIVGVDRHIYFDLCNLPILQSVFPDAAGLDPCEDPNGQEFDLLFSSNDSIRLSKESTQQLCDLFRQWQVNPIGGIE